MLSSHKENFSDLETIEAIAAAWIALRDDSMSIDDEEKYAIWLKADIRHAAAIKRLTLVYTALQDLRNYRPLAQRHPDSDLLLSLKPGTTIFSNTRVRLVLAACIIAAFLSGYTYIKNKPTSHTTYTTTVDGYQVVNLSDGSVIQLNSNSSIVVEYSKLERRITLDKGEASFLVAKNPARPLWVLANGIGIRAVGTAFDVRLTNSNVAVLVTEGKVAVSKLGRQTSLFSGTTDNPKGELLDKNAPLNRTLLIMDQRALFSVQSSQEPNIENLMPKTIHEALAWQSKKLIFVDTPLSEVVNQFNQNNTIQISLSDLSIANIPVGGSFRADNVDAFLRLLESSNNVLVDRKSGAQHIVLRHK